MSDWDDNDGLDPWERPDYADAMADRADDDLKRMREEGTYGPWVAAGRPGMAEWNRRQLEDSASAAGLDRVATDVARESGESA